MAVVLTLLGCYAVLLLEGRDFLRDLRESIAVVVELRPSATAAQRAEFEAWLGTQPYVKSQSVRFIDKSEGARLLSRQLGTEASEFNLDNPLYDLYTFNFSEGAVRGGGLDDIEAGLLDRDAVLGAYLQRDVIEQLTTRVDSVAYLGLALGLLLLFGVVFLVVNTTQLALLSRRRLIKSMELVGASWGFIARPFLRRSIGYGAVAGLLAGATVWALSAFAKTSLAGLWTGPRPVAMAGLMAALAGLGIMINFAGTFYVINRTLRMRVDDLAAFG